MATAAIQQHGNTSDSIRFRTKAETFSLDSTTLLSSASIHASSSPQQHILEHAQSVCGSIGTTQAEQVQDKKSIFITRRKDSKETILQRAGTTTPPIHITMAEDDEVEDKLDGEEEEHEQGEPETTNTHNPEAGMNATQHEDTPDASEATTLEHSDTAPALDEAATADVEPVSNTTTIDSPESIKVASKHNSIPPSLDRDGKAHSIKSRPASQQLMSAAHNGRDRSSSPGRFPVKVDGASVTSSRSVSPAPNGHASPSKRLSVVAPEPSQSADVESVQAQSSAPVSAADQATSPGGMFRKASSGFGGLLGRMGNIRKTALSPPPPTAHRRVNSIDRRNSANSTGSFDHAATSSLAAIIDGPEGEGHRPTLQDRFRTLREQEEHPDENAEEMEDEGEEGDIEHDPMDETASGKRASIDRSVTRTKRASSTLSQLKGAPPNPNLPPGTASGMSAGPAKDPTPVNWDLWQNVVNEGPAAVARTSGEELSKAIASGIPAAIRGVVWQVLAESKSDELEALYRTLKTRGSEPEQKPLPLPPPTESEDDQAEREVVKPEASSRSSSIHSVSLETPTATSSPPPQPTSTDSAEAQSKLLAEKHKRESAAIQKLEKAIRRDLGTRTSYSKYTQSAGLQDGLFGVCKAYALFDTHVGYAQGINFIAMPLLFNMPEEEAFTLLVKMMHHFHLRTLFEPEMPGLHLRLYQFERLLEDREAALYCHLKRRHVSPQLYATQWFLTLFAYRFPLQLVLRVYDLLFTEGLTAIMKFGLVLMQRNRAALLEMKDMSQLTTFLKERLFDVYIDKSPSASSILDSGFFGSVTGGADKELYRADELVQDATQVKISPETLHTYEIEWEELCKTERDREAELEHLRSTNAGLASRVKVLEERVQQHDQEHVGLASDLVKYKVENDSLHDTKEALEMQVLELQKMVDAQPAEVEAKLKAEMDRIMQRNLEVQNENRHLQDELENAEQQLIKISMTHAETQADFDTLKQKWSGLQAMMNGK